MNETIKPYGAFAHLWNNSTASPDDRPDDGYDHLLLGIRASFLDSLGKDDNEPLFTTNASNLYDIFLDNLPSEARQHYNCNTCRHFVNRYGGLVTIDDEGYIYPVMWNFNGFAAPDIFTKAIIEVYEVVEKSKVNGVFITSDKRLGIPKTGVWTHMAVDVPKKMIYKGRIDTAQQKMAEKAENYRMLRDAIFKYSTATVESAVNILRSETLYRSEKTLGIAEWFLKVTKDAANNKKRFSNIVWRHVATAPTGFCHISSSMIGTLLDDIVEGFSFDTIKRRFDEKMNPLKYQRPQAAPSIGNVKRAEEIVAKLGIANSLKRRFARLDEIETIWKPIETKTVSTGKGGVFAGVKTKESMATINQVSIVTERSTMTWEKFRRTILPNAKKMELVVDHSRNSYAAIVTAEDYDAPPIIAWDNEELRNPFNWYLYSGGSLPSKWNMKPGYVEVTGITLQPNLWQPGYEYQGNGVMFILKDCKDTVNRSSALFPETLRSELREVRSTIEAYSRDNELTGYEEASACGLCLQASNKHEWDCTLRVTTDVGVGIYKLDRWD